MSYKFDGDYMADNSSHDFPTKEFENFFNQHSSHFSHNEDTKEFSSFQGYQHPQMDDQRGIDAETWKYGEGEFDYLADDPNYGVHGSPVATSSHRKPWVHYFLVDNIKYVVVMVIFYVLFMARIDALGIEGLRYEGIKSELLACYIGLVSLLFIKSTWRLFKMR